MQESPYRICARRALQSNMVMRFEVEYARGFTVSVNSLKMRRIAFKDKSKAHLNLVLELRNNFSSALRCIAILRRLRAKLISVKERSS